MDAGRRVMVPIAKWRKRAEIPRKIRRDRPEKTTESVQSVGPFQAETNEKLCTVSTVA